MSGGEALAEALVREGVEVVFGIPGIHMSGIVAALRDDSRIRMITTRHEAAASHMADGYARVSGKPGVVLVVPGAGVYNAATGLATAYARSSPVLAIAGQIPRGQAAGLRPEGSEIPWARRRHGVIIDAVPSGSSGLDASPNPRAGRS